MAEELKEDKLVVPADKKSASKKVKVELEVDTSAKDLGPNPYARLIHLARAIAVSYTHLRAHETG